MRRRILFTGGSELASTTGVAADGFAGVAAPGGVLTLGADN